MNDGKSVKERLDEKLEDRGWGKYDILGDYHSSNDDMNDVKPLPLSDEEYQKFALLLGKLSVQDQNPNLCDIYFELRDRATKGNHYKEPSGEEFWKMEEAMFEIGSNPDLRNKNKDSRNKK